MIKPKKLGVREYLTEEEFCAITGRARVTAKRWRKDGRGPEWRRLEGRIVYPLGSLREYLRTLPGGGGALAARPEGKTP
jgi:hypothetical protein